MTAEISSKNLERALGLVKNASNFVPTTPEEMQNFLLEGYNKLIAKVYLAEAEIIDLFTFTREETEDGALEVRGIADFYDAIGRGLLTLSDLIDEAVSALKFSGSKPIETFLLNGDRMQILTGGAVACELKINKEFLKVKDFIIIRQEFFERLNNFTLLEEGFLTKVLKFAVPALAPSAFLELFSQKARFSLIPAYLCLFYIVESVSGVKKNWIF